MKKIGLYITDITKGAGTERVVINLANYLTANGYIVTIVSFSSINGAPFFFMDKRIRLIHLNLKSYIFKGPVFKVFLFLYNLIRFVCFNRDLDFDVVIGSSRNTNIYALIGKKNGQKLIGCEHFAWNVPIPKVFRLIRDSLYRRLDRLVVLTKRDESYYLATGVNALCIPNAVSIKVDNCLNQKENIAIAIGRHSTQKAFDKLLNIWSKARSFNQNWQLCIIGEGELFEDNIEISKTLKLDNSVIFIPPTKDILEYYRKSSLYLMTSLYEAFPMVLIEAKACCLPIISYDCDTGPKEIIRNNEDGFLIPFDDEDAFLDKLRFLIENRHERDKLALAAFENSNEFSIELIMPKWLELFDSLNL